MSAEFSKISEEYNRENVTYMAIEKEAAEKEFHKAEDLYYNLKNQSDQGKIDVEKFKINKKTMTTNLANYKTKMDEH